MADKVGEPEKRKPGRPRKRPLKEPQKRLGRVDEPSKADNVLELVYDKPSDFNKLGKFFKSLDARSIKFAFTPDGLVLFTKNHKDTNDVGVRCAGEKMNRYYCPQDINVGVNFADIEPILNKLDKSYEMISFLIRERTRHKTLHIVLQNDAHFFEFFDVGTFISPDIEEPIPDALFSDDNYALEFRLTGKYFKKMISDIKAFDKSWTIEKYGDKNLMFTYNRSNVQAKIVPGTQADINLRSRVTADEIFSVSIYVDTIKPTSSIQLGDWIQIKASKDRPLCIWADINEKENPGAIMVNVLAQIVDHRQK